MSQQFTEAYYLHHKLLLANCIVGIFCDYISIVPLDHLSHSQIFPGILVTVVITPKLAYLNCEQAMYKQLNVVKCVALLQAMKSMLRLK